MTDSDALRIEKAIRKVQDSGDESALIEVLLEGALNWPLSDEDDEDLEIDDISYDWDDVLAEMGFTNEDGPIELRQVMPFPNWPLGIFIVKFGSNRFFTQGRGMTTPLRTVLRKLMAKHRPTADHRSWKQEHLLFLCHNNTEYFQFARFENPSGGSKTSKLQMFGWGPNDHVRTVCEYNLKNLIYSPGMNKEQTTEAVASAFDVSKVSKSFYQDYKKEFDRVKPLIAANSSITDGEGLHRATQTLFNRLLFLRFIEKKGWLSFDDSPDYLRSIQDSGGIGTRSFYASRLRPLFFRGLAIEGKQKDDAYGEVPFLNGGLFEESNSDKEIIDLPDEVFEPLLGPNGLFYRYNFTVQESTPLDVNVAIDPEMIGTMFEELVTGRNEKGAFYTPRVVVAYMCREAIKSVLEERTDVDADKIRRLVDEDDNDDLSIAEAKTINEVLSEVKAIDPACGSGAYLLGLLHELVRIHTLLSTTADELSETRHEMKLRIISRSIYGVDLDPFATKIAMLRLWLSLTVEAPEPIPLPNLDFNIETGDSLLAPDPSAYVLDVKGAIEKADTLAIKKEKYLASTGVAAKKLRAEIKEEETEIRKLLRKQNDEIGSVDFRVHFASVFTKNRGFDIVLANPPYVPQSEIGNDVKNKLHSLYGAAQNSPTSRKSDLYCYFYVRAMQLLRQGGVQIFICSNSWLDTSFGGKLQRFFLSHYYIEWIMQSEVEKQFASAEINTIISKIVKRKSAELDNTHFLTLLDEFSVPLNADQTRSIAVSPAELWSNGCDPRSNDYHGFKWSLFARAPQSFWNYQSSATKRVGDFCEVNEGRPTGANPFFFPTSEVAREYQIPEKYLSPGLMKTRGVAATIVEREDCSRFYFHPPRHIPPSELNSLKRYLEYGQSEYVSKSKTLQGRGDSWHYIAMRDAADLLSPCGIGKAPFCALNKANAIASNSYTEFRFRGSNKKHVEALHSFLNHPIGWLCIELFGRTNLGGGMLKVDPIEYRMIPMVPFDISNLSHRIPVRKLGNVFEESGLDPASDIPIMQQTPTPPEDRVDFDSELSSILGVDPKSLDDIYREVCNLVNIRHERARNRTSN